MFDNQQERDLLWSVIRKLTFLPAITVPVLCESASEVQMGRENYDIDIMKMKSSSEYENGYKRFQRLFQIMSGINDKKTPISKLLPLPKSYDAVLGQKRLSLYNHMAEKLGWQAIGENAPSINVLFQVAQLDGGDPYKDIVTEKYPYYYVGERNGFDFIEYILLLNISLISHHRTQTFFERQLINPCDKVGISRWIEKVTESMHSDSLYMSYVDTFLSVLYYETSKQNNQNVKCWEKIEGKEEQLTHFDLYNKMYDLLVNTHYINNMYDNIVPITWILLNLDNKNNYRVSSYCCWLEGSNKRDIDAANKYAVIIKEYIDQAILEAESILPTFFDSK